MKKDEIPILFIGQCKSGSNTLFEKLAAVEGFAAGEVRRASYRAKRGLGDYYSNWPDGVVNEKTRFLLDKTMIAPKIFDYRLGRFPERNRMIYQIRDPYKTLKSQFLFAIAGETCWRVGREVKPIKKTREDYSFEDVCAVIEWNLEKVTHYHNIEYIVDNDILKKENILFTTLENMKTGEDLKRVEKFLDIKFDNYDYPVTQEGAARYEKLQEYAAWGDVFDAFAGEVYARYVIKEDYEKLSGIVGFDLVKMYNIT